MNVTILGAPGAGKGTVAKQLATLNYTPLTPGQLYRTAYEQRTDFGVKAHSYWGSGGICPDDMTNELMRQTIANGPKDGLVFDGYPRTLNQAQYLDGLVDVGLVLDLSIPDDVAVERLLRRSGVEHRIDDTEDVIRQRLKVYHSNNEPIVTYYLSDLGRYRLIDANRDREVVWAEVKELV